MYNDHTDGWTNTVEWEFLLFISDPALEIVFDSVQQKHLDKTIFRQQVVDFVWKTNHTNPAFYPFMADESNPLGHDCS